MIETLGHIMNEERPDIVFKKEPQISCNVLDVVVVEDCLVFRTFVAFHSLCSSPSLLSKNVLRYKLIRCTIYETFVYEMTADQYREIFPNTKSFLSMHLKRAESLYHSWDAVGLRTLKSLKRIY